MIHRLKRLIRRVLDTVPSGSSKNLRVRVRDLENELDEYRRDSLRVAEMLDLLEQRLTPGGKSAAPVAGGSSHSEADASEQ